MRTITSLLLACSLALSAAAQDIPPVPQPAPPAPQHPKKNPFLWPGVAILAGGIAMAVYGFSTDTHLAGGVAVAGGSNGVALAAFSPGGTVSMGGVGVAVAAVGGLVIYLGHVESKNSSPMIVVGPRSARVVVRWN
ncbi:MAG TPA: hypothetical protein VKH42_08160 [Vicinamibacterales bacterium]|nr:hypothetical protein [Vicinamibacterales bacterium]